MTLGDKLKLLREDAGLTQKELSVITDIPRQNISKYEKNERQPDYATLKIFASFFKVTIDYLLSYSNDLSFYDLSKEEKQALERLQKHQFLFHSLANASDKELSTFRKLFDVMREAMQP